MIASEKPRSNMTRPRTTYITPMRLWSTLVNHSRHRYGHQPFTVTVTRRANMTRPTTAPLSSGSGSLNGMADQVSFPSISISRPMNRGSQRRAGRPCRARDRLVDDVLEEVWHDRAVGRRRHGDARLCQLRIPGLVKRGPGAAHLPQPTIEIAGRHRLGDKPHLGETVAAVIC